MSKSSNNNLYLLVESAAGYCIVYVKHFNNINIENFTSEFEDVSKFLSVVKPKSFLPFNTAEKALNNALAIANGEITDELKNFLSIVLPNHDCKLGVIDVELARNLAKQNYCNVVHNEDIFELMRWARFYFCKLVDNLTKENLHQFQLGLGHSFSRNKIASDPAKQDKNCTQAMATLDLCDRLINRFYMRLKEWYGWHFPELVDILSDYVKYAQSVLVIGNKDEFEWEPMNEHLLNIVADETVYHQIHKAAQLSIGYEINELDLSNMKQVAKQLAKWASVRSELNNYFSNTMNKVAPNLTNLIGENLAAKLITHAGSICGLAKAPASTIQILGSEKALFRALKNRGPTPKFGMLYASNFISTASPQNKGKISRVLANKVALASRMDAFGEETGLYGVAFKNQIKDRMKYITNGDIPPRNVDVMSETMKKIASKQNSSQA
uniref:Nucleolar protein 56 n=1 Tax=Dermatophagoides pteronyssinus TaxID=6956 RepID=A0A6P6YB36_DERPT|nr:nucleolar protein 56-like [Dermatophagoides pteronyssinus]